MRYHLSSERGGLALSSRTLLGSSCQVPLAAAELNRLLNVASTFCPGQGWTQVLGGSLESRLPARRVWLESGLRPAGHGSPRRSASPRRSTKDRHTRFCEPGAQPGVSTGFTVLVASGATVMGEEKV
jgi:hypothetical protein